MVVDVKKEATDNGADVGKGSGDTELIDSLSAEQEFLLENCPMALKLVQSEIERIKSGKKPDEKPKETPKVDPDSEIVGLEDYVKLVRRVRVPAEKHPKVNFIGRIVGPKGSEVRRIQESTGAFISIQGRGSTHSKIRDKDSKSNPNKHDAFDGDLHVQIKTSGPMILAYSKMARALEAMKLYLNPTDDDEITLRQRKDLGHAFESDNRRGGQAEPIGRIGLFDRAPVGGGSGSSPWIDGGPPSQGGGFSGAGGNAYENYVSQSPCHVVDVTNRSPLGRICHYDQLDLGGRSVTSIDMAFGYIKLLHHGFGDEAEHLITDEKLRANPEHVMSFVFQKVTTDNVKFLLNTERIYEAIFLHQLERPDNPFRLDLEGELAKAPDPRNVEFRTYQGGSGMEYAFSCGFRIQHRLLWEQRSNIRGFNRYGRLLDKTATVLADQSPIENDYFDELMSNMDLFQPPKEKSLLLLSDDELYSKIFGGDVITVDGKSFADFTDQLTGGEVDILDYDYIVINVSPMFCAQLEWEESNHGFDDFVTVLSQFNALRSGGNDTILFVCPYAVPHYPRNDGRIDYMIERLSEGGINHIHWKENNPFVWVDGVNPKLFDYEDQLSHCGIFTIWRRCCEVFPPLIWFKTVVTPRVDEQRRREFKEKHKGEEKYKGKQPAWWAEKSEVKVRGHSPPSYWTGVSKEPHENPTAQNTAAEGEVSAGHSRDTVTYNYNVLQEAFSQPSGHRYEATQEPARQMQRGPSPRFGSGDRSPLPKIPRRLPVGIRDERASRSPLFAGVRERGSPSPPSRYRHHSPDRNSGRRSISSERQWGYSTRSQDIHRSPVRRSRSRTPLSCRSNSPEVDYRVRYSRSPNYARQSPREFVRSPDWHGRGSFYQEPERGFPYPHDDRREYRSRSRSPRPGSPGPSMRHAISRESRSHSRSLRADYDRYGGHSEHY